MTLEKLSVPIAIIIAGALIAVSLYFSDIKVGSEPKKVATNTQSEGVENMRLISNDDHILGNPKADVIIVEYSDTECPYCKVFHTTLKRVMEEYGKDGKVAWVYRHFPIDSLHPKARKEAEATECANELGGQSKFWEYINLLYTTTNSNNSLDPAELPKMAKTVGLDVKAFSTCLSSGKYAEKVDNDYKNAIQIGGAGTPTSVLISKDGTKTGIEGALTYEKLKTIIDAMLE